MNQTISDNVPHWTNRQIVQATVFVVAVGAAFWLLYEFRTVIFILFVSMVLGTAIRPMVDWLNRRGIPRGAGVIIIYVVLLGSVLGFIVLVVPMLADQVTEIAGDLPKYYGNLRSMIFQSPSRVLQRLVIQLPPDLNLNALEQPAEEEALDQVAQTFTYAGMAVRASLYTLSIFLLAFYWTMESERTIRSLLLFFPSGRRDSVREVIADMEAKVGGFIRGQAILCMSIGLLALVAYVLIGVPFALVLAIIAGVLEAVPVFGPALGAIPAILVVLSTEPTKVIWIIAATAVIQTLENYLLVPRVMKRSVGVNPFVTLLSLAAFASLLGLAGALLAIPMAAIIQMLLNRIIWTDAPPEGQALPGRDYYNVLRYEAQSLSQDVRKQLRVKENVTGGDTDHVEDTIETIANDLDRLLAQVSNPEKPV